MGGGGDVWVGEGMCGWESGCVGGEVDVWVGKWMSGCADEGTLISHTTTGDTIGASWSRGPVRFWGRE